MKFLSSIIHFIMAITKQYSYDESHGMIHSFNTMHTAYKIYENELHNHPELKEQEKVILVSAVIHDMCDKKYMDEIDGISRIDNVLENHMSSKEILVVHDIVSGMSYSKVKKKGFPDMGDYQAAYNVVREADLLEAYDFDRAMIYHLYHKNADMKEAYKESLELFKKRMFRHEKDGLLTFEYTKTQAKQLKTRSIIRMKHWKKIIRAIK